MKPLFSRRQSTRGVGLPEALQERVAFSPSRTETSPSDVPVLSISGGTERTKLDSRGIVDRLRLVIRKPLNERIREQDRVD